MEKLTKQLQERLYAKGYRYFALIGVRRIEPGISAVYVIHPIRTRKRGAGCATVSIMDGMVMSVVNKENKTIQLYVVKKQTQQLCYGLQETS
jgi:hypothetical protein